MEKSVSRKIVFPSNMADGPTAAKKIKIDEEKQILLGFWQKKELRKQWIRVVDNVWQSSGYTPVVAFPLKIESADADLCRSFSNAHCFTECHYDKEMKYEHAIGISKLFKKGCTLLRAFLSERLVPEDKQERNALKCLIDYLSRPNPQVAFEDETDGEKETERNWCIKMAQHLFSQLSQSKKYTIDNKYLYEGGSTKNCPCADKDELFGTFGDTSFGCVTLWHGSADLLFGMPLQLVSQSHLSDSDIDSDCSVTGDSSSVRIEAKGANDFTQKDKYQMRAQVIGFSFYIHKVEREMKKEEARYFLIPHIGFSKEKICFRFYDSVNDILLETKPFDLFERKKEFSRYVILLTWLVLNYNVFGGETPARLIGYKSGFHEMFPNQLNRYKEEVEHPCHTKPSLQKEKDLPLHVDDSDVLDYVEEKSLCTLLNLDDL